MTAARPTSAFEILVGRKLRRARRSRNSWSTEVSRVVGYGASGGCGTKRNGTEPGRVEEATAIKKIYPGVGGVKE